MAGSSTWVMAMLLTVAASGGVAGRVPAQVAKSTLAPPPLETQSVGALDTGSAVSGRLEQGDAVWPEARYLDAWSLVGRAGSTVTVDLLSDDFDAVLYLVGSFDMWFDDDGAGGCDARLQIMFPVDGTYRLYASTYYREQGGAYTLRVSNRPPETIGGSCPGRAAPPQSSPPPPPNDTCLAVTWMQWMSLAAEAGGGPDFPILETRRRTACDLGLETASGETWPNGRTARQFSNWYYPNGQIADQFSNRYYPNGQIARQYSNWYYPNGQLAHQFANWFLPDGTRSSAAGIIEYALPRLAPARGEELMAHYRENSGEWQEFFLVVMASEASR